MLSSDDLDTALKVQSRLRLPIGEMAVAGGYMDFGDVQRVLEEQKINHELFGRVSMDVGLLDQRKVGL